MSEMEVVMMEEVGNLQLLFYQAIKNEFQSFSFTFYKILYNLISLELRFFQKVSTTGVLTINC